PPRPASPYHLHLPPRPTTADVTRAVLNLLAPTPDRIITPLPGRPRLRSLPNRVRRRPPVEPAEETPPPVDAPAPPSRTATTGLTLGPAVYERLFRERIVFLGTEVDDEAANRITGQLLQLAADDPEKDIIFYINSPGGSVTAGMAIYDTM